MGGGRWSSIYLGRKKEGGKPSLPLIYARKPREEKINEFLHHEKKREEREGVFSSL